MSAYVRLARLPPPNLTDVDIEPCIRRVVGLETRLPVRIRSGPTVTVRADKDQLEQALINLVSNAADAVVETDGSVEISWCLDGSMLQILVEDGGAGDGRAPVVQVRTRRGLSIRITPRQHRPQAHGDPTALQFGQAHRGAPPTGMIRHARLGIAKEPMLGQIQHQ